MLVREWCAGWRVGDEYAHAHGYVHANCWI